MLSMASMRGKLHELSADSMTALPTPPQDDWSVNVSSAGHVGTPFPAVEPSPGSLQPQGSNTWHRSKRTGTWYDTVDWVWDFNSGQYEPPEEHMDAQNHTSLT
jgi:hypothetical protein